jgi:hypothetical protein
MGYPNVSRFFIFIHSQSKGEAQADFQGSRQIGIGMARRRNQPLRARRFWRISFVAQQQLGSRDADLWL